MSAVQTPIDWIMAAACKATGVTPRLMRSPRKFRSLVNARWFAASKMRAEGYSYPEIGRALGGFDHSTIIHLLKRGRK